MCDLCDNTRKIIIRKWVVAGMPQVEIKKPCPVCRPGEEVNQQSTGPR
jgi:hypothetical protein